MVAVGNEINLRTDPHRHDVLGLVGGDILNLFPVPDPDVVRLSSAVVFPGAELAHGAVVREAFPVRTPAAEPAFRQRQFVAHATFCGHGPEIAFESVADAVAVDDALAIRLPAHHDVVRPHAVAQVIPAVGRCPGQPDRRAALRGDGIDFRVAVILPGEGDGLAVRREFGKHLITFVGSQAHGLAAGKGGCVQISGIGENDVGAVGGGESQEPPVRGEGSGRNGCGDQYGKDQFLHIRVGSLLPC